jgi:hypothetical protein
VERISASHDSKPRRIFVFVLCVLAAVTLACGGCTDSIRPDRLERAELLALMQTLNADLLSHDSATLTLERWCNEHHLAGGPLAPPARITARRVADAQKSIPNDLRERLAIDAAEPLHYRRVQLVCGERVLSEADNWYVPSRLTAEMNHALDTTNEPFGKVVKPLGFQRRTLSAALLWSPLPPGWEMSTDAAKGTDGAPKIPHEVLRHSAILFDSNLRPFSAVVETYTNEAFDFGPWGDRRPVR